LLSADILALRLQRNFVDRMLWNAARAAFVFQGAFARSGPPFRWWQLIWRMLSRGLSSASCAAERFPCWQAKLLYFSFVYRLTLPKGRQLNEKNDISSLGFAQRS
jgi:hypothetical protein